VYVFINDCGPLTCGGQKKDERVESVLSQVLNCSLIITLQFLASGIEIDIVVLQACHSNLV